MYVYIIIIIIIIIINNSSSTKRQRHVGQSQCAGAGVDSLRGSSGKLGTIQIILAWPLRKDDTHKSRSVNKVRVSVLLLDSVSVKLQLILYVSKLIIWGYSWGWGFQFHWLITCGCRLSLLDSVAPPPSCREGRARLRTAGNPGAGELLLL